MPRDSSQRQDALTTHVTIIQLQAALLQRQIRRRGGLSDADRRWLETALDTIEQAAHAIPPLLEDANDGEHARWLRGLPTGRLTAFALQSQKN
jgi:hypothetical protein